MSSPTLIEDDDSRVQYSGVWIKDPFADAHGGSRHGAALAGITVTLDFEGTGIQVIGILDRSVDSGYATTSYYIDGKPVSTYTSPFEAARQFNIPFYSVHDLSAGKHTILITNDNGTSPNQFWLDYFLVDSGSSTPQPTSSLTSQTPSPTSPSISSQSLKMTQSITSHSDTSVTTPSLISTSTTHSLSSTTTPSTTSTTSTASTNLLLSSPSMLSASQNSSDGIVLIPTSSDGSSTWTTSLASADPSTSSFSTASLSSSGTSSSTNANIIGGAVGGTVSLALIAIILFFVWRFRKNKAIAEKALVAHDTSSYAGTEYRSAAGLIAHRHHCPCCAHSTSSCCSHSHGHSHARSRPSYSDMSSRPSHFGGSIISRTNTMAGTDEPYSSGHQYYGSAHLPSRALSGGRSQSREHYASESRSRGRGRSRTRHRTVSSVPTSQLSEISPPPSPPPANWSLARALADVRAHAQTRSDADVLSPRRRDLIASEASEEPGQPDEMVELDRGRLSAYSYSAGPERPSARLVPSTASGGTGPDAGDGVETIRRMEVVQAPWYAPSDQHPDAQSLLSAVAGRRERRRHRRGVGREGAGAREGDEAVTPTAVQVARPLGTEPAEEEDSGLRMYAQSVLPPRYTAE